MRRFLVVSLALCVFLGVAAGDAAATRLTSKNSVSFKFAASTDFAANGVGCGSTASITFAAKVGAYNMVLTTPKVGDTFSNGTVRVASITIVENVATIALVADGAGICNPVDSDVPPASIPWSDSVKVAAEYDRRVQVPVRNDFTGGAGVTYKLSPKTIWNGKGATGEKFYGLKWRAFGSKKAVGKGRLLQLYCHSGDNCPQNRKRAKITLSNPGFCAETGQIEYRHIKILVGGRFFAEIGDEKNGGSLCNY